MLFQHFSILIGNHMEGRKRECKAKLSNVVRRAGEKGRILMGLGKSLEGDKVNLLQETSTGLSEVEEGPRKSDSRRIPCDTKVTTSQALVPHSDDLIHWNEGENEDFSDKCLIRLSGRRTTEDWSAEEGVRDLSPQGGEIRRWSNNDVISSETEKALINIPCDKFERFSTMPKLRKKKKAFVSGRIYI